MCITTQHYTSHYSSHLETMPIHSCTCTFPLITPPSSFPSNVSPSLNSTAINRNRAIAIGVGEDLPLDYAEQLPKRALRDRRRAGVLLHPTSFGGAYGIGDIGNQAFEFLDWLHLSGCSLWQVLPLVPPGKRADGSPYAGQDANCGNTLLISLEELVKDGLLMKDELPAPIIDAERVDFSVAEQIKYPLIAKAAARLISSHGALRSQLEQFQKDPSHMSVVKQFPVFDISVY